MVLTVEERLARQRQYQKKYQARLADGHVVRRRRSLAERFWEKVEQGPSCWEWRGATNGKKGYGKVLVDGRPRNVHRIAWELTVGPVPAGLCVLHRCDNPLCVRPDHLWLGTDADNYADMIAKGRAWWQRR